MEGGISVSVGGGVELERLDSFAVPLKEEVVSFLTNKINLNYIFLNCPFTSSDKAFSKAKELSENFRFTPLDYKEGTFESISISALCEQEELSFTAFSNILTSYKNNFILTEKNCINFLLGYKKLPESFRQKTLIYFLYTKPEDIKPENFSDKKASILLQISQIMKDVDGPLIKMAL